MRSTNTKNLPKSKLQNKIIEMTVLLTGSSGCLGKEIVSQLEAKGVNVVRHTTTNGYSENCVVADFSNNHEVQKFEDVIVRNNVTCLINNAGVYSNRPVHDLLEKEIVDVININLVAPIILSKYLYKHLSETRQPGKIININSLAGKYPNYLETIYCASKHGLAGFGSSLSINSRKSGITIHDLFIGGMKTRITANRENYLALMEPSKVAKIVAGFVFSSDQCSVTSMEIRN